VYVVVVYDVNQKRLPLVEKLLQQYLQHTQLSVFEGELTTSLLKRMVKELQGVIDEKEDSVRIYVFEGREQLIIRRIGRSRYQPPSNVI